MKTKGIYLVAAAALIISISAVNPTIAYFTDTTTAEARIPISIGDGKTEISEKVENMVKKITIKNTGDYDVFVRAKAIYPDSCTIELNATDGWSAGDDGYYYYSNPVTPDDSTATALNLHISRQISDDADIPNDFTVVIIQEATKALYDADGNPAPDWKAAVSNQINLSR